MDIIGGFKKFEKDKTHQHNATSLKEAVFLGDEDAVKKFICEGADVNVDEALPLITYAVKLKKVEIVKILLEAGADISKPDYRGNLPIHYAVTNWNFMKSLFEDHFNQHIQTIGEEFEQNTDVLGLLEKKEAPTRIGYAASQLSIEDLETYLKKGGDSNFFSGRSPLVLALRTSDAQEKIQLLLKYGANPYLKSSPNMDNVFEFLEKKPQFKRFADAIYANRFFFENERSNLELQKKLEKYQLEKERKPKDDRTKLDKMKDAIREQNVDEIQNLLSSSFSTEKDKNGNTILHFAALQKDPKIVEMVLEKNESLLNSQNNFGVTPLMFAVMRGHVEIVRFFLKKGVNTTIIDGLKRIALSYATDEEIKKMLVDPLRFEDEGKKKKKAEQNMRNAATYGSIEGITRNLRNGADVNSANSRGETALHYASSAGNAKVVQFLIEKGADVNATTNNGQTPLMLAAGNGHVAVLRILLEQKPSLTEVDSNGKTALFYARSSKNEEVVNAFSKHIDLLNLNRAFKSSLEQNDYILALKKLNEGADIDAPIDNDGNTPLLSFVREGNVNKTRFLLKNGAEVDKRNSKLQTPLMWASFTNNVEIAKMLLEYEATPNAKITGLSEEASPLSLAIDAKSGEIVKLLLDAKADPNSNVNGRSVFQEAVSREYLTMVQDFLDAGAGPNEIDISGDSALTYASYHGSEDMIRMLLRGGGAPSIRDSAGEDSLDKAYERFNQKKDAQSKEILALIKSFHCSPNARSRKVGVKIPKKKTQSFVMDFSFKKVDKK